jgi:myo-inositol-1(or 4)-monophosphatase
LPATDLALLKQAAREAGAIATRFFDSPGKVWQKADGAGPVTEADLAVDAMLRRDLLAAHPGHGWLSEESDDDPTRLTAQRQFIIDPIDGTRAFVEGSRDWAHSLAIAEQGVVTCAVVYLPMRKLMYCAQRGQGATLNGQPILASFASDLSVSEVLAARSNFDPHHWQDGAPPMVKRAFRSSLAYRLCLVAEGRFDAMLTLRPAWEWDIAAGSLIVAEAGGTATDSGGLPLRFNNPMPQVNGVVAGGRLHGPLMDRLAEVAPIAGTR